MPAIEARRQVFFTMSSFLLGHYAAAETIPWPTTAPTKNLAPPPSREMTELVLIFGYASVLISQAMPITCGRVINGRNSATFQDFVASFNIRISV